MSNYSMQKGSVETSKNRLLRDKCPGPSQTVSSECILFCQRVGPNVFNIKDGFAVVSIDESCYNDGVCMISNSTKVVFVFEQTHN